METKLGPKFFLADDTTVIIELHPNEMQLIKALRNRFRFGEITIIMRDGLPMRLRRITEFEDLTNNLEELK